MNLVVLGANGRTGRLVVQQALEAGHTVTAIVRTQAKRFAAEQSKLRFLTGDPCDPAFLAKAFFRQDAVISTLGGRSPSKQAASVYWKSADAIVEAAWVAGLKSVVVTSSALLFPSDRLADALLAMAVTNVVRSAERMERTLAASGLDVIVGRCGFLTNLNEGAYRAERSVLPSRGSTVSRLSLARFLLDSLQIPQSGMQVFGVAGV